MMSMYSSKDDLIKSQQQAIAELVEALSESYCPHDKSELHSCACKHGSYYYGKEVGEWCANRDRLIAKHKQEREA